MGNLDVGSLNCIGLVFPKGKFLAAANHAALGCPEVRLLPKRVKEKAGVQLPWDQRSFDQTNQLSSPHTQGAPAPFNIEGKPAAASLRAAGSCLT